MTIKILITIFQVSVKTSMVLTNKNTKRNDRPMRVGINTKSNYLAGTMGS